jgi:ankyrin repeat protein
MLAIYNGYNSKIDSLLTNGADVNFLPPKQKINALEVAIRRNIVFAVRILLEKSKIENPESYIMTASGQDSAKTVELLLKYGANVNDTLNNGYSVLMFASSFGSLSIVELLLKNGADVTQTRKVDGITALMLATYNGDPEKVKLLLNSGANKLTKDKSGKAAYDYIARIPESSLISEERKRQLVLLLK